MSLAVAPVARLLSVQAASSLAPARSAQRPLTAAATEPSDRLNIQAQRGNTPARDIQFQAPLHIKKSPEFISGEILVSFKSDAVPTQVLASLESGAFNFQIQRKLRTPQSEKIAVPERLEHLYKLSYDPQMGLEEVLSLLNANSEIHFAEPNYILSLQGQESGGTKDLKPELWGLHNTGQNQGQADADIDAPEAWALQQDPAAYTPIVGVIDTGVDYTHPELREHMWKNPGEIAGDGIDNDNNGYIDDVYGWDFANDDNDPMDGNNHGTHVAGTIAAQDNGEGITGVTQNARIMALKFLSDEGSGTTEGAIEAILYANAMGVDFTNNSWGGGGFSVALREAIASGPLFIAAAGNNNKNNDQEPHYPASYELPNVISVAASDRLDQRASFSNYGQNTVDLAAPGKDILSSIPGNSYASYSGTSMATPHVAGVAALILNHYPQSNRDQLKARLLHNVDRLTALSTVSRTGGRLNAYRALENDTVAPARVQALKVTQASPTDIQLAWQASGDDGHQGQSTAYEIRYARDPLTEANWETARQVQGPTPGASGQTDRAQVSRLTPFAQATNYYVGVRAVDNVGNRSEITQIQASTPGARVLLQDLAEAPHQGMQAEAPWGYALGNRSQVWSDSPNTDYANDSNVSLFSREVDLSRERAAYLSFQQRFDLEHDYDFGIIEVSNNQGLTWREMKRVTGKGQWQGERLDLSAFAGQKIQLRFRLQSDQTVTKAGWDLDDITLVGEDRDIL